MSDALQSLAPALKTFVKFKKDLRSVAVDPRGVVVIIADDPEQYTENRAWLTRLGTPQRSVRANWHDSRAWTVEFLEHGTVAMAILGKHQVADIEIEDVWHDPEGLFGALEEAPAPVPEVVPDVTEVAPLGEPDPVGEDEATGEYGPTEVYDPTLYDFAHAGLTEDVGFYTALAQQSGGPVLELGVGTGRVALAIARAGVSVTGLDLSSEMIASFKGKLAAEPALESKATVVQGDMRQFALDQQFPLITIPFRAFLHNVTRADQLACLSACRNHLAPGGTLAFNVFHPSLTFMGQRGDGAWRWDDDFDTPGGGFVSMSSAQRYDTVQQRVSARIRYERYSANAVLQSTSILRLTLAYLYPGDIEGLLRQAGFSKIEIQGGFGGGPLTHDGQEQVVIAQV